MPKELVSDAPEPVTLDNFPSLLTTLILTAAAGGMGWGIRGQYGHETGAMMAGLLVALVIGLLFCASQTSLFAARMAALTAIGIGFGGSLTYGQTVGLTHDAELVGNWAALRWGLVGLAIKGGIWIGFAGVLMGMGLGGKRYRALEILLLFIVLFGLSFVGLYALNEPFDPANRQLPKIYFSDDWYWEPNKADLEPRRERWGGLLFALAGLWFYVAAIKRDAIARNLGLLGLVFGALGFAGGQCVQAYHSWNLADFQQGWLARIEPYMNWWNTMETIFGMILGLGLGLGVWLHRRQLLNLRTGHFSDQSTPTTTDEVELSPAAELVCLAAHVASIAVWNFMSVDTFDQVADHALTMGILPLALVVGGRYSPYLMSLPIVAFPIAGKTLREMSYYHQEIPLAYGWSLLFLLPVVFLALAAIYLARRGGNPLAGDGESGQSFARWSLLLTSWTYFALNFVFFRYPWPWEPPTSRTPNAIVFAVCLVLLTLACLFYRSRSNDENAADTG
jgi:hypothetical protein